MANHLAAGLTLLPLLKIGQITLIALLLTACSEPSKPPLQERRSLPLPVSEMAARQLGLAQQAANATTQLVNVTAAFLERPNEAERNRWQSSWIDAHEAWLSASILIPDERSTIDPWPIEPGFIDSLPDYPESGLVNDLVIEINGDSLRQQHQITDAAEVALGFHVLEYYIFERPLEEFLPGATRVDRRSTLINEVARILLQDQLNYSRRFFISDGETPEGLPLTLSSLLPIVAARTEDIYQEYRYSTQHSRFSDRRDRAVSVKLQALRSLLTEPPAMNDPLASMGEDGAALITTIDQAINLLADGDPDTDTADLLLLLSDLNELAVVISSESNR